MSALRQFFEALPEQTRVSFVVLADHRVRALKQPAG